MYLLVWVASTDRAPSKAYKHLQFVLDIAGSVDEGLAAQYKALYDMATITKTEAVLVKLLTIERDQAKLRQAIQAEDRSFRGIYGKGQEKAFWPQSYGT
eukprot:2267834-Amphidinium_carterae.5